MRTKMMLAAVLLSSGLMGHGASAAELKVLTTGAVRQILLDVLPAFEAKTGHKVKVDNDTNGGVLKRIEGGEAFDLVIVTPAGIRQLAEKNRVTDKAGVDLAKVGVGVMVKAGAPKPEIGSVEGFKQAVLAAKSVSYIDPASGGSSGIYLNGLFKKLGISDEVRAKAKLKQGGHVADYISSGQAELGMQQISEIVSEKGVTLVGPLPAEIQNYTIYAANLSPDTKDKAAATALLDYLASPAVAAELKAKGMEPAH